jgi:hypothetical protein
MHPADGEGCSFGLCPDDENAGIYFAWAQAPGLGRDGQPRPPWARLPTSLAQRPGAVEQIGVRIGQSTAEDAPTMP